VVTSGRGYDGEQRASFDCPGVDFKIKMEDGILFVEKMIV
jgi:hypothetical protein